MAGPNRHRFTITVIARFWYRLNEPCSPLFHQPFARSSDGYTVKLWTEPVLKLTCVDAQENQSYPIDSAPTVI